MLKGWDVARNGGGNDDPDGEAQDQGAGAEAKWVRRVSRIPITPTCRTPWSLCDLNRERRQDVKKYAHGLRSTAHGKANGNHRNRHRVISVRDRGAPVPFAIQSEQRPDPGANHDKAEDSNHIKEDGGSHVSAFSRWQRRR